MINNNFIPFWKGLDYLFDFRQIVLCAETSDLQRYVTWGAYKDLRQSTDKQVQQLFWNIHQESWQYYKSQPMPDEL